MGNCLVNVLTSYPLCREYATSLPEGEKEIPPRLYSGEGWGEGD